LRVIGIIISPLGGADDMPNGAGRIDRSIAGNRGKGWLINSELIGEEGRHCLLSAVMIPPLDPYYDYVVIAEIHKSH
jgi:hypothetical protein